MDTPFRSASGWGVYVVNAALTSLTGILLSLGRSRHRAAKRAAVEAVRVSQGPSATILPQTKNGDRCRSPLILVMPGKTGRGERIRTSDLTVPNRALYQAEPRPENADSG